MDMLDVVHGEHRGPAVVEAPENGTRSIKNIRFVVHQPPDLLESEIVGEFKEFAAARKQRCAADFGPQREEPITCNDDFEMVELPKLLEEMLIPFVDEYAESAAVSCACEAFQKTNSVRCYAADKGRIHVEAVDSDPHRGT